MDKKLLRAVNELVEASFRRDFVCRDGDDDIEIEERVFDAVRDILDEIVATPELVSLHGWARSLQEAEGSEVEPEYIMAI
jgi:hypothetical protein